jgi:peptide-methionine (S)-S-oxide reductase
VILLALVSGVLAIAGPTTVAPNLPEGEAEATAVFAGGCFWGVEAVFEHLRGVHTATSGYTGRGGGEGGVEAVRVVYDPSIITYRQLLEVFFRVAHDPTLRDRQGPDIGPQYRAMVFYANPAEHSVIQDYLELLRRERVFAKPIVTEVQPLGSFDVAEAYHQDYAERHSSDQYIVVNDHPKLERLRRAFPGFYQERKGQ